MVKATVVSTVVLLLAITGCSEKTNPKIDSESDADIKKMATQLPLQVSEVMSITGMERDGKKVIYTYSFIKPDIKPGKFDTKLALEAGKAQLCKAKQTMDMMNEGYVFVYRYKYMTGDVETVSFSKGEC